MVGGTDKQIYVPYQLAQNLGFYKKYGVNVQLPRQWQSRWVGRPDSVGARPDPAAVPALGPADLRHFELVVDAATGKQTLAKLA
jgi:hypothetical protein